MKWANIKWAVIATILWPILLIAINCAGAFIMLSQELPAAELQARSRGMGVLTAYASIIGWVTIWFIWLLARPRKR